VIRGSGRGAVVIATLFLLLGVQPSADARSFAQSSHAQSALPPADGGGVCDAPATDPYTTAVLADSPLVYYPLDESSGTDICDQSGNANYGTYASSGVTYGVAGPLADSALTAVQGDGSSPSLLGIGSVGSGLNGNQSFTLEGWYKAGSSPPNEVLVAMEGFTNDDGLAVWKNHTCGSGSIVSTDVYLALDEAGQANCWDATAAGMNLQDGSWHYLAITYNAGASSDQLSAYVDGQPLGAPQTILNGNIDWDTSDTVLIGGWIDNSVNQPFVGDAAQIAIYGTALSAARIAGHYSAASPAAPAPTQTATVTNVGVNSISNTSEKVLATITTNGQPVTYSLEYGLTDAYGHTAAGGVVSAGSASVSFTLTSLIPGTEFHYKVLASTSSGEVDTTDHIFTTSAPPGAPPPLAAPVISNVTSALTGLTTANISGDITNPAYAGLQINYYIQYATHAYYVKQTDAKNADPYDHSATYGTPLLNQDAISGVLAKLRELTPGTTYDYRVVAKSSLTTNLSYSADATITTPPTGPTVTTSSPTSVSSTGAGMNGLIDDKGLAGKYTFNWSASVPPTVSGCGATTAVTGSMTGNLGASNATLQVSALFNQQLPTGTTVTYTLEFVTKIDGFTSDVSGGPVSFSTGSFSASGAGTAAVTSGTTAILAAEVPGFIEQPEANVGDPIWQFGTDSSGGIEFTGTNTTEFGVFQYSAPGASAVAYTNSTNLATSCGTVATASLSGLQPDTKYSYSPDQAYGLGTCPAMTAELPTMPITNVDQVGVDYCWIGSADFLAEILSGGLGEPQDGSTDYYYYQAEYPFFIGAFLGNATTGLTGTNLPYAPIVGPSATFTTAATTAPSKPTVSGTGVSDGLGCLSDASCGGTQTLKYAASASTASAARTGLKRAASKAIVLGETKFSIKPHQHKTIRFKLSRAGKTYLAKHPKATNAALVIVEQAGHGPKVTITRLLATKSMKPTRVTQTKPAKKKPKR
jgi:hypothetical protein